MTEKVFVLDDKGFVELLDVFGSDLTVVNAARVSFAKESHEFTDQDGKLVRYLAKHHHVTPFFHPQIHMRIKMPIFVAREWYRHQIGFARNEVSRRYVDSEPECYIPEESQLRERDSNKKQGSKETPPEDAVRAAGILRGLTKSAMESYTDLLFLKVAPEVARMVLPQSMYTEFIETGSLAAYARLCNLRLDPTAQKEIRDYATTVDTLLRKKFPVSWAALMVITIYSASLSGKSVSIVSDSEFHRPT
jgi:thymidylate synthase (FAD)